MPSSVSRCNTASDWVWSYNLIDNDPDAVLSNTTTDAPIGLNSIRIRTTGSFLWAIHLSSPQTPGSDTGLEDVDRFWVNMRATNPNHPGWQGLSVTFTDSLGLTVTYTPTDFHRLLPVVPASLAPSLFGSSIRPNPFRFLLLHCPSLQTISCSSIT